MESHKEKQKINNDINFKSISQSKLLLSTLILSRKSLLFNTFNKFSTKSKSKSIEKVNQPNHQLNQLINKSTLLIGCHTFYDTKLFNCTWLDESDIPTTSSSKKLTKKSLKEHNDNLVLNEINKESENNPHLKFLMNLAADGKADKPQLTFLSNWINEIKAKINEKKDSKPKKLDLVFEFKDNSQDRWILPMNSYLMSVDDVSFTADISSFLPWTESNNIPTTIHLTNLNKATITFLNALKSQIDMSVVKSNFKSRCQNLQSKSYIHWRLPSSSTLPSHLSELIANKHSPKPLTRTSANMKNASKAIPNLGKRAHSVKNENNSDEDDDDEEGSNGGTPIRKPRQKRSKVGKKFNDDGTLKLCAVCKTNDTSAWRRGPQSTTVCNKCSSKLKSGSVTWNSIHLNSSSHSSPKPVPVVNE